MRGDWQARGVDLPTVPVASGGRTPNPLSALSRWKLLDNLRQSLVKPSLVALVVLALLAPPALVAGPILAVLAVVLAPIGIRLADLPRYSRNLRQAVNDLPDLCASDAAGAHRTRLPPRARASCTPPPSSGPGTAWPSDAGCWTGSPAARRPAARWAGWIPRADVAGSGARSGAGRQVRRPTPAIDVGASYCRDWHGWRRPCSPTWPAGHGTRRPGPRYRPTRTSSQTRRWSELGNGNTPVSRNSGSAWTGQNTPPPRTSSPSREGST